MKKFLTVSLATLLAVSSLSSVSLAAPNVGPGEVTNVTPADFAENVDRNAVLEAVIKDPNGLALKNVDFMKGFKYDFGSDNGITGFQGSSAIDLYLLELTQERHLMIQMNKRLLTPTINMLSPMATILSLSTDSKLMWPIISLQAMKLSCTGKETRWRAESLFSQLGITMPKNGLY
nr:hypothetical protein [Planococcus salinarum]